MDNGLLLAADYPETSLDVRLPFGPLRNVAFAFSYWWLRVSIQELVAHVVFRFLCNPVSSSRRSASMNSIFRAGSFLFLPPDLRLIVLSVPFLPPLLLCVCVGN